MIHLTRKIYQMPTNDELVLLAVGSNTSVTSKDIVAATGLSKRAVSVAIGRLVEDGKLQRGDAGSVRLTEKGKK